METDDVCQNKPQYGPMLKERTYGLDRDGCSECGRGDKNSMTLNEFIDMWGDDDCAAKYVALHLRETLATLEAVSRLADELDAFFAHSQALRKAASYDEAFPPRPAGMLCWADESTWSRKIREVLNGNR